MTDLRARMIREMELRRFSPKTQEAYVRNVKRLTTFFLRPPNELSLEDIRAYFHHMIVEEKLAASSTNQAAAAITFFYRHVLGWTRFNLKIRQKQSGRLPQPLSREEVAQLIAAAHRPMDRVVLMTAYATGMRVSELVHIKCTHIESERMLVRVEQGKRGKDRYTLLSPQILEELRKYWKYSNGRSSEWLFPSRQKQWKLPITASAAQRAFNRCKDRAGIKRGRGIHTLRHSCATHLLEAGVDIRTIQMLLGHSDIKTTMRYLQVTQKHIASIQSPFTLLRLPRREELDEE